MSPSADDILRIVAENASRDFGQAQTLPPAIYHDADILRLETERLFARGWICVGRTAEIPHAGDFICCDIVDQPVFVMRQKDGTVSAFPNVCLHRCSKLLDGRGHVSKVSCPYHSWTYDLGGQLIAAPFMQKTPGFATADYRLAALPCETWQGFIYVSLDRAAVFATEQLQALDGELDHYRIADYVPVYEETEVWHTNWKCLVENFMDSYHIHRVHAATFGKYASYEHATELFPGNDAVTWLYVQEDGGPNSVAAHPDNTWLTGDRRHRTFVVNVFPTHVFQLQPDLLWYLSILPDGLDKVRIRWAVSIPQEFLDSAPVRNAHIEAELDFLRQVNSEDRQAVERVFEATAMREATQGPLSWLERNCWEFGRYLARELVG